MRKKRQGNHHVKIAEYLQGHWLWLRWFSLVPFQTTPCFVDLFFPTLLSFSSFVLNDANKDLFKSQPHAVSTGWRRTRSSRTQCDHWDKYLLWHQCHFIYSVLQVCYVLWQVRLDSDSAIHWRYFFFGMSLQYLSTRKPNSLHYMPLVYM